MRMLIRPSNDSLKSMEWKTKMKRNSLINITLTEEEITMKFLVFLRMHPWMRLKKLTGDFLCSIILRTTLTMLMLEKNSMKWTKPTMPCPQKLKDTTMTLSHLVRSPLSELTTSLKISGETDSVNGMTLMISSDQLLEPDGAAISTECWMKEMKIGAMWNKDNPTKHHHTTLTRMEWNQRKQFPQRQKSRMEDQWVRQPKNIYSLMETKKFARSRMMAKEMSPPKCITWRKEKTFLLKIDLNLFSVYLVLLYIINFVFICCLLWVLTFF